MSSQELQDSDEQVVLLTGSTKKTSVKPKVKRKRKTKIWNYSGAKTLEFIVIYKNQLDNTLKERGAFGFKPKCHPDSFLKLQIKDNNLVLDCSCCSHHLLDIALMDGAILKNCTCPNSNFSVFYEKNRLHIACESCKKVLSSFMVSK